MLSCGSLTASEALKLSVLKQCGVVSAIVVQAGRMGEWAE